MFKVASFNAFCGRIWGPLDEDDHINNADLSILPWSCAYFIATPLAGNPGAEVLHFTSNDPAKNPSGPPTSSNPETSYEDLWMLLLAFSHFVYDASKHTMVLVDIQGTI